MAFVAQIRVGFAPDMPADQLADVMAREVTRGEVLKRAGTTVRISRVPGRRENVGIWHAATPDELHDAITSLPAFPWIDARVTPLATNHLDAAG